MAGARVQSCACTALPRPHNRRQKRAHTPPVLVRRIKCFRVSLTKSSGQACMTGARQRGLAMALMLGIAGLAAVPAPAFEIFGIHLWGEREEDEAIEVIDPLPYAVTWRVAGGEEALQRRLETASSLWSDRESPASGSAGLIAKARGDYRRLLGGALRRGLLRAGDQHPRRRHRGRRRRPRLPVPGAGAGGHRRRRRPALPVRARGDRQRGSGRGLRARRHRDAGGGRLPPRGDRAVGAHQPGLGADHRAVAAPGPGQGARGRPRGDRRPCDEPARRHADHRPGP